MLITVLVIGPTMCLTGDSVIGNQMLWGTFYLFICGSLCYSTNMYVTGGISQEPRFYDAVYLSLSAGEFTSTSFLMFGSWYLPIFLFRDRSLIDSKQNCFFDGFSDALVLSANITEAVNGFGHDQWCCNGHGWVRRPSYVLWIFLKMFCQYLHVFFFTVHSATLMSMYHPTFLEDSVSALGVY